MEDVTDTQNAVDDAAVVDTRYGPVRGGGDGTVEHWLGIRYAAAPVGDLRWRAPQPPQQWTEPADATRMGPVCPQPTDPRVPLDLGAPQGTDCLTLNIWAPRRTGQPKPVLVWVHGGAYVLGSSAQPLYNGRVLAADGDVVVVTVNYRLGAFGFLDLSWLGDGFDTNPGLRDVLFALHWVRDNIANFGGDPERVTLFGESAGAGVVTTLLASPAAEGLFGRAIAQSSPVTSVYDRERAQRIGAQFLGELGMTARQSDQLGTLPVPAIIAASKQLFNDVPRLSPGTLGFAPIVDGDLVPDYPVQVARAGRTLPVPLIIGTNEHEAALFRWMRSPLLPITGRAITEMFAAIAAEQPELQIPDQAQIGAVYRGRGKKPGLGVARDVGFRMPTIWFAEGHGEVAPVYMYRFDWSTPMLRAVGLGGAHATELPYVFGNLVAGRRDPTFKLGGLAAGTEVSRRMRARWCNFAAGGTPAAEGAPPWRRYDHEDRANLLIGRVDQVVSDPDRVQRGTWGTEVLSFR
ncbi:carboxylesterase/lipase family protein [Mycolicibacterium bacteremicum]|uniref:Carboxylic ester hydrolase n=1 Tax=Mycolicibacterium bacteremicum TaxID=564198 RepID=A0A1W9YT58_MYCBA|nr:carboxylesterase/lipase family protein [Mycolicibacterium bacteremicum]MCV7433463.1 carboxylesterase/lipase family protein [Mycolicibacterium bacteremicum]ORA03112.1 carboxylesterase [Mycolicibacterium bacteremicum]